MDIKSLIGQRGLRLGQMGEGCRLQRSKMGRRRVNKSLRRVEGIPLGNRLDTQTELKSKRGSTNDTPEVTTRDSS